MGNSFLVLAEGATGSYEAVSGQLDSVVLASNMEKRVTANWTPLETFPEAVPCPDSNLTDNSIPSIQLQEQYVPRLHFLVQKKLQRLQCILVQPRKDTTTGTITVISVA